MPWSRLAGAAGLAAVSFALYWATTDRTFAVDPTTIPIEGERFTSEADIRAAMDLPQDRLVNIFRIATTDIETRIEELPAVRDATITATLPGQVEVTVEERSPLLVWKTPAGSWLVDGDGRLFGSTDTVAAAELGTGATGTHLPAVDDQRAASEMTLGSTVPPLDMAVVRLLLTITPELLRSSAPELHLSMVDEDGYVLDAPGQWRAVFGPYTPVLRSPDIIPSQVQCLDALLANREEDVVEVTLALSDEACGTYRERSKPRVTAKPGRGGNGDGGRKGNGGATPRP